MRFAGFFKFPRRAAGRHVALLVCSALSLVSAQAQAETVTVFAAASLKPVFDEITDDFQRHTGHNLALNFSGSALIARQIERGAPADVFVSANADWMDFLADRGLINLSSRFLLSSNRLALVSSIPNDAGRSLVSALSDLTPHDRIAMGLVDAVPAGQYGKSALEKLQLWSTVQPHIVQTDSVRAALALVNLRETRFAIVYASDAVGVADVTLVGLFAEDSHARIEYPAAAVGFEITQGARSFLTFLRSDAMVQALRAHGFRPEEPTAE